jgi:hypothetical protein
MHEHPSLADVATGQALSKIVCIDTNARVRDALLDALLLRKRREGKLLQSLAKFCALQPFIELCCCERGACVCCSSRRSVAA